jgi:FtsP/CotA-like multicopper oxidase with cupredoxin domain
VGTQLDRGLYGPLIIDDPAEPSAYDHDWVVVLDDWIDGTGHTPGQLLALLRHGMPGMGTGAMSGMSGMNMSSAGRGGSGSAGPLLMDAASALLGGDAGDVKYPYYLVNGRIAAAPRTFRAAPGQRARIRFINAGGDTSFRVALGGHRMLVTHADGHPVNPVETDALLIAMGERYDVTVTLGDGVFPLTALAEGKHATARALIRTGSGPVPPLTARPPSLTAGSSATPSCTRRLGSRCRPGRPMRCTRWS